MKVAIVHDFLLYWGGAERVLKGITKVFPHAPVYTLRYDKKFVARHFPQATIRSSFLQSWPLAHRALLPFMPTAAESLRLDDYEVVISSGTFSKGIIVPPHTRHIHYCHTPPRFLWEENNDYMTHQVPMGAKTLALLTMHWLRIWDQHAATRVDTMIANSAWTQKKIKKVYQRDTAIVYPFIDPVLFQKPTVQPRIAREYLLIVSRLQYYKHIDLAIQACNNLRVPLVIIGEGPDRARLQRLAGPRTQFIGFIPDNKLSGWYAHARALLLPGIEDFGLTPIEAAAQGTPTLAYRHGGAKETIIEGNTGFFSDALTVKSIEHGMKTMLAKQFTRSIIKTHAQRFSFDRFRKELLNALQ